MSLEEQVNSAQPRVGVTEMAIDRREERPGQGVQGWALCHQRDPEPGVAVKGAPPGAGSREVTSAASDVRLPPFQPWSQAQAEVLLLLPLRVGRAKSRSAYGA